MEPKKCFKCGEVKSIDEFYRHPRMADGHLGKCKECTKADTRANYRDDPIKHQEYEAKRAKTERRKEDIASRQRQKRQKHPEKYLARQTAARAVASGRIEIQPCEKCRARKDLQMHHDDYTKPLDVRWLCFNCHRILHGQEVLTNLEIYGLRKIRAYSLE